jgi:hypothetical protein
MTSERTNGKIKFSDGQADIPHVILQPQNHPSLGQLKQALLMIGTLNEASPLMYAKNKLDPDGLIRRVTDDDPNTGRWGELTEAKRELVKANSGSHEAWLLFLGELADIMVFTGTHAQVVQQRRRGGIIQIDELVDMKHRPNGVGRRSSGFDELEQALYQMHDGNIRSFHNAMQIFASLWGHAGDQADLIVVMDRVIKKVFKNRNPYVYSIYDPRFKETLMPEEYELKFAFLEKYMSRMRKALGRTLTAHDWRIYYWLPLAHWVKSEQSLANLEIMLNNARGALKNQTNGRAI